MGIWYSTQTAGQTEDPSEITKVFIKTLLPLMLFS